MAITTQKFWEAFNPSTKVLNASKSQFLLGDSEEEKLESIQNLIIVVKAVKPSEIHLYNQSIAVGGYKILLSSLKDQNIKIVVNEGSFAFDLEKGAIPSPDNMLFTEILLFGKGSGGLIIDFRSSFDKTKNGLYLCNEEEGRRAREEADHKAKAEAARAKRLEDAARKAKEQEDLQAKKAKERGDLQSEFSGLYEEARRSLKVGTNNKTEEELKKILADTERAKTVEDFFTPLGIGINQKIFVNITKKDREDIAKLLRVYYSPDKREDGKSREVLTSIVQLISTLDGFIASPEGFQQYLESKHVRKPEAKANHKAQEEADRKAKEEADRIAREWAARMARENAAKKTKEEADRKAKEEADRIAREGAARMAEEREARRPKQAQQDFAPDIAARQKKVVAAQTKKQADFLHRMKVAEEETERRAKELKDLKDKDKKRAMIFLSKQQQVRMAKGESLMSREEIAAAALDPKIQEEAKLHVTKEELEEAMFVQREQVARMAKGEPPMKKEDVTEAILRYRQEQAKIQASADKSTTDKSAQKGFFAKLIDRISSAKPSGSPRVTPVERGGSATASSFETSSSKDGRT